MFNSKRKMKNQILNDMKHSSIIYFTLLLLLSCSGKGNEYDATGVFEAAEVIVSAGENGKIKQLLHTGKQIGELFIQNPAGFSSTKCPESGILQNFSSRSLRERKFCRIFLHRVSGKENSAEFSSTESPGRKILQNFPPQSLRDEKFCRIPLSGHSGMKNPTEFSFSFTCA
jgi:hypothetical protein